MDDETFNELLRVTEVSGEEEEIFGRNESLVTHEKKRHKTQELRLHESAEAEALNLLIGLGGCC